MTIAIETCKEIMTMECILVEKQACTTMTEPVSLLIFLLKIRNISGVPDRDRNCLPRCGGHSVLHFAGCAL